MDVIDRETEKQILQEIKEADALWSAYFKENNDRYDYFRSFIYDSSLSPQDKITLEALNRPTLEAPMLPSYLDRQLGEFSNQEFGFSAQYYGNKAHSIMPLNQNAPSQGMPSNPQMMRMQQAQEIDMGETIATHLDYLFSHPGSKDLQYAAMQKGLSGGFFVIKCVVEYEHPMSATPKIDFKQAHDPTMCFFDVNARDRDKGDGNLCGEKYLMTVRDFKMKYPHVDISAIDFDPATSDSTWAFHTADNNVLIVCEAFKKKKIPIEIVKLSNNEVIPKGVYDKIKDQPGIYMVGKPVKTHFTRVIKYTCIDNQIIDAEETDFPGLPNIFGRGNGEFLKKESASVLREMTIPFGYYARDLQRLQNYTMNSVANEIENVMQHKLMVAQEALPTQDEWLQPYHNYQQQSLIVYKSRYVDTNEPIMNPVSAVPRTGAPPEIFETYASTAGMIQKVLGTFDSALGANAQQNISGTAIMQGALNSNMAASPYVHGLAQALESCAQLYVDMLPRFIHHYENLPVITKNGKHEKIPVKSKLMDQFNYYPKQIKVKIKVGAAYQVQKQQAVMMVGQLMQMVPPMQQFFSTEGLSYILDNLDGRNIDSLKLKVEGWVQQQTQMQQQAQQAQMQEQKMQAQQAQAAMQNNPALIKKQLDEQRLMFDMEKSKQDKSLAVHKMDIDKMKALLDHHIDLLKIKEENKWINDKNHIDLLKAVDDSQHKHHDRTIEVVKMAHEAHQSKEEKKDE